MKIIRNFLGPLGALLLAARVVHPQTVNSLAARIYLDPQGIPLPYRLWVPTNYTASIKYPLVMYLHGAGGSGTDNLHPLMEPSPLVFIAPSNQVTHPCLMIAPQCPFNSSWETPRIQQQVRGLLDTLQAEFNLDPDRFYITGVSMGGFGTWSMISQFPDTFAAAVALCGYANNTFEPAYNRLAVWYFQAQDDTSVDIAGGDAMIKAMRQAGGHPIFTRYDSGGHAIWTYSYATPSLVDWVMAQRRGKPSPFPPTITMTTPTSSSILATAAKGLVNLSGTATNLGFPVTGVSYANNLGGSLTARGTTNWYITWVPLKLGTNILTFVASGGSTTFSTTLTVIRESPVTLSLTADGANRTLNWTGGVPPFQIEMSAILSPDNWTAIGTNTDRTATFPQNGPQAFYRVSGQ